MIHICHGSHAVIDFPQENIIIMNTTNPNHIQFSPSEEAFFLNCVGELMKVWASKSGKAGMHISVQNGLADLQLNFQLGSPGDPHLSPQPPPFQKPPRFKTPHYHYLILP